MFLYNVHTPNKTFAIQQKDGESFNSLLDRIAAKSGLSHAEQTSFKGLKEGSALQYEYEGERWSLEDDDDLSILLSRIPPSSSTGATLHLTPPSHHAHFSSSAQSAPPVYSTASGNIKSKAQSQSKGTTQSSSKTSTTNRQPSTSVPKISLNGNSGANYQSNSNGISQPAQRKVSKAHSDIGKHETIAGETADGMKISRAKSVRSTRSRKSKYGNDDVEPLGEVHKRKWLEFHANNGVRTVIGKVGGIDNVRMLLKSGYKQVYISRSFAIKAGLVGAKFGMGTFGYTGLKSIGDVPITVGGRTGHHQALVNEEQHFDVVLGRQWLEKMAVKVDPLDQTVVTYMDTGEVIPCDLVVLKDAEGNVITVT